MRRDSDASEDSVNVDDSYASSQVVPTISSARASYQYSFQCIDSSRGSAVNVSRQSLDPSLTRKSNDVFIRGSLAGKQIEKIPLASTGIPERPKDYKGRIRTWPGVLLFLLLFCGAIFSIYYQGLKAYNARVERVQQYEKRRFSGTSITGGKTTTDEIIGGELISDDGAIGNPNEYPDEECELPDYQSKDGHVVAVSENGTEVPIKIKGINWFGMETGTVVPLGLWSNSDNGTTLYQIARFLSTNKFNGVRLPVCVDYLLKNTKPPLGLVNSYENRALSMKNYMSMLQSIIKAFAFRRIGVLISMHTLTSSDHGEVWFDEEISEDDFLDSIDVLTKGLCSEEYFNIMGIDLKNEPYGATWGDGTDIDYKAGAERIANRMLEGCPQWMGFVEGINGAHSVEIDGTVFDYYDWYGGGLQPAKEDPLKFDIKNKIVYAPHYYNSGVYPQDYLYESLSGEEFVELDDATLRSRIKGTMDHMFGFLASETGPAVMLGEFGGLYAKDLHPKKTTQRCTDFQIEVIKQPGWAGGFVWSLNPESAYQYNPVTPGHYTEGVLEDDWLSADDVFLKGMEAMDDMDNLVPFPCFPKKSKSSSKD